MSNIFDFYKDIINRFEQIIHDNVVIKLAAFKGFDESLKADYETTLKSFPLLYFIVESLHVDCVLTVNKLVEDKGERTIKYLLKFTSANLASLQAKYPGLTSETLQRNERELKEIKEQIQRVKTQRDRYYAHADKKYFLEPGHVIRDFPNTHNDLADISSALQRIIGDHRLIIHGNMRVCMSDAAYLNTFRTVEFLKSASKKWYEKYRANDQF